MSIDEFFYEHPVFRYEEFALFKATQGITKSISVNTALMYYVKSVELSLFAENSTLWYHLINLLMM